MTVLLFKFRCSIFIGVGFGSEWDTLYHNQFLYICFLYKFYVNTVVTLGTVCSTLSLKYVYSVHNLKLCVLQTGAVLLVGRSLDRTPVVSLGRLSL